MIFLIMIFNNLKQTFHSLSSHSSINTNGYSGIFTDNNTNTNFNEQLLYEQGDGVFKR